MNLFDTIDHENRQKRERALDFRQTSETSEKLFYYINASGPVKVSTIEKLLKLNPLSYIASINAIVINQGLRVAHDGDVLRIEEIVPNMNTEGNA